MAAADPILAVTSILIFAIFGVMGTILIPIFTRYKQRKSKVTLYLGGTFLLMDISIVVLGIGALLEYFGLILNNDVTIIVTFSGFLFSSVFVGYFIQEIFALKIRKFLAVYLVFLPGIIVLLSILYPIVGPTTIIPIFAGLGLTLSVLFYTTLALKAFSTRKKIEDVAGKQGFFNIGIMGIFMDACFFNILLDSFFVTITPFMLLGLSLALLALIAAYFGFIRPTVRKEST